MKQEKTINEVIKEFKTVFGDLEFKAVQLETGLTVVSRSWVEPRAPRLVIRSADYIGLGQRPPRVSAGVLTGILQVMGLRRVK